MTRHALAALNIASRYIVRRSTIIALLALFCAMHPAAQAQPALRVRVIRGLDFAPIFRTGASSVPYYSGNAAIFEVIGHGGRVVQLAVGTAELTQARGPAGRSAMKVNLSSSRCAYSIDNGMSWKPFEAGSIWQSVRMASQGPGTGKIIVRVGGEIIAAADQHRGDYAGCITLTAIYE
jgi:hypothetical protein